MCPSDGPLFGALRHMSDILRLAEDALAELGLDVGVGIGRQEAGAAANVLGVGNAGMKETRYGQRQGGTQNSRTERRLESHVATPNIKTTTNQRRDQVV